MNTQAQVEPKDVDPFSNIKRLIEAGNNCEAINSLAALINRQVPTRPPAEVVQKAENILTRLLELEKQNTPILYHSTHPGRPQFKAED